MRYHKRGSLFYYLHAATANMSPIRKRIFAIIGSASQNSSNHKLVVGYTVSYADTKDDFLKAMYKEQPCLQKIVYVFSAAGKIDIEKNHCEHVDPDGTAGFGTKYVVKGNKITVSANEIDPETYDLEIKGNKMTWRKTYEKQRTVNPKEDIKLLEYVFERG